MPRLVVKAENAAKEEKPRIYTQEKGGRIAYYYTPQQMCRLLDSLSKGHIKQIQVNDNMGQLHTITYE
jgi:hypothetical protein